jgi:cytochrome P450
MTSINNFELAPRYAGNPVANYLRMRWDTIALFTEAFGADDIVRIRIAYRDFLLVRSPGAIRQMLVEDSPNFPRQGGSVQNLRPYIGANTLTTNGREWEEQRRAMRAVLTDGSAEMTRTVLAATSRMIDGWTSAGERTIDAARETIALTYSAAAETYFGYRPDDGRVDEFAEGLPAAETGIYRNWIGGLPVWKHVPTRANLRLRRGYSHFLEAAREAHAKALNPSNNCLAGRALRGGSTSNCPVHALFAHARRPGEFFKGLLAAAPENPSNVVSWTLYLLARHPKVLARLRAEVDREHENLPYLEMVIAESMRLYPGAWAIDRVAATDTVVEGVRVPRGTQVILSIFHLHRNPRYHADPNRFDPARFARSVTTGPERFAYLPFGAGARQCVGMKSAQSQVRLIVAEIVRRVDFDLQSSEEGRMDPMFTLRPKTGIRLVVRRRAESPRHCGVQGFCMRK